MSERGQAEAGADASNPEGTPPSPPVVLPIRDACSMARPIARACARMAHQILEANRGARDLVLLGIPTRGVLLARRLAAVMAEVEQVAGPGRRRWT